MLRLCLTLGALCLLTGCTNRSLEGTWYGPLPLGGGQDCRIRLMKGGRFEFTCKPNLLGQGSYIADGDKLNLTYVWLVQNGKKIATPVPVDLHLSGGGNRLIARTQEGTALTWERRMK